MARGRTRGFRLLLACLLLPGCSAPPFIQISDTSAGAYEASLVPAKDGYVAAWYDTRHGHGEIYARRLDADGQPIAPERRLTIGEADAYEASLAPLRNGFAMGWYEKHRAGRLIPKLGVWSLDGTARWVRALSTRGRNTVVRAAGGLVFAAWIEDEGHDRAGVWVTWHRSDNVDLIRPRRVADAGRTTWNLNAALDPDVSPGHPHAWIVFDAVSRTSREELFLVETDETTDHVVQLTGDDGAASKYPDITFNEDRMAITWFDTRDGNEEVYLAVGSRDAFRAGRPPSPRRITATPGHSIGAYLAWGADRLGLAWCDDTSGNQEVYFQPFDRDGSPEGPPTRVTTTPASSSIPSIQPAGSRFALLWHESDASRGEGHGSDTRSQVMFRLIP